jgi:hypothetical protein
MPETSPPLPISTTWIDHIPVIWIEPVGRRATVQEHE